MSLADKLVTRHVATLKPYESARRLYSGGQDWLNANESPFANAYSLDDRKLNRYPSCQPDAVIKGYANYANVAASNVLTTRGADEGIELLIRTFCEPKIDKIVTCPPTYGMYAISAETCNVGIASVPLLDGFKLDVENIIATEDAKLIFICSPNNPTGTNAAKHDIEAVLKATADRALVVVDEAYIEFDAENSWAKYLNDYPNLVILRTLSKGFALAGIRCGFTLAHPDIINALLKVIAPYPIPEPVAQIAAQALSASGLNHLAQQVDVINQEKRALTQKLTELDGIEIVGGQFANFVLIRLAQASTLMTYLVERGMLIRDQSKQLQLSNCLRITVGSAQQNARLIELITTFLNENAQ